VLLLDTRLESGPNAAREARASIARLEGRLNPQAVQDAILMVSELVTNSYRHSGIPEGAPIELRVSVEGRKLRIEVADGGTAARPSIRTDRVEGGWGLKIVEQIASRWGTETGPSGTIVWLELDSV